MTVFYLIRHAHAVWTPDERRPLSPQGYEPVQAACTVAPEVRAWGISGSRSDVIDLILQTISTGCDGMTIDWPDWVSH